MSPHQRVLVVEDDDSMRFFLVEALEKEGYACTACATAESALDTLLREKSGFDLAILDYNLPGQNGLDAWDAMRAADPALSAILVTGHGNPALAMTAMDRGIYDYFTKPVELNEIRVVVRRALERSRLLRENRKLRREATGFDRILGNNPAVRSAIETLRKAAAADVPVLIHGESGTGKELAAQALHASGPRCNGPFIKINCAAIPQELLEAEFFGYEKGAFTGAVRRHSGKFEQAHGGVLFLDEIGEMPPAMQKKLLRALQEKEVTRIGAVTPVSFDARIVTATNRDLQRAVAEGAFREDLFYRINVVAVRLPPLREHPEDISLLASHLLKIYNEQLGGRLAGFSRDALALLQNYSWPGNVREMENVIQRAIVLGSGGTLQAVTLREIYPPLREDAEQSPTEAALDDRMRDYIGIEEKRLILDALTKTNWRRQDAAKILGVSRKTLHNKMKKYAIGQ